MFHRLLDQISDLVTLASISFVFGLIKIFLTPEPENLLQALGTLLISVVIGTLAGAIGLQYGCSDVIALLISSFCSLLAKDIIKAILNNRRYLSELIKRAADNLVDKFTK